MNAAVEALRRLFAAVNRNDMDAMTKDFDPQIVRVEPDGFPGAGTYRGIPEVRENIRKGRGTWAEGTCEPEKFLVNGSKVVVYLHAWVRLKQATNWTGGRFADGFVFRHGKITEYRTFRERAAAREWAGIDGPDPS
ncbi:MAG TPA: nuclear transport factor 2 family protein [Lacunisphaera sp.]|nr:nuclear transport factor 2 family protein [Lacunisphaera sp.]